MLEVKDLRIGNLFNHFEDGILLIEEIKKDSDGFEGYYAVFRNGSTKCHVNYLTPIELTEEWLFRFGFERHELDNWFYLKIINDWTRLNININGSVCELSISNHGAVINVTYVHQLQNLIYVLTQKELTLKDEK